MADPTGFEPAISSVTGWHVGPLHHGSVAATGRIAPEPGVVVPADARRLQRGTWRTWTSVPRLPSCSAGRPSTVSWTVIEDCQWRRLAVGVDARRPAAISQRPSLDRPMLPVRRHGGPAVEERERRRASNTQTPELAELAPAVASSPVIAQREQPAAARLGDQLRRVADAQVRCKSRPVGRLAASSARPDPTRTVRRTGRSLRVDLQVVRPSGVEVEPTGGYGHSAARRRRARFARSSDRFGEPASDRRVEDTRSAQLRPVRAEGSTARATARPGRCGQQTAAISSAVVQAIQ